MSAEGNELEQATEGFVTVVAGGALFRFLPAWGREGFLPRGLSPGAPPPPGVGGLANPGAPLLAAT